VAVSLPVRPYPQEPVHGNAFEAHVKDDWSHAEAGRASGRCWRASMPTGRSGSTCWPARSGWPRWRPWPRSGPRTLPGRPRGRTPKPGIDNHAGGPCFSATAR
jgi:hypothetical protein